MRLLFLSLFGILLFSCSPLGELGDDLYEDGRVVAADLFQDVEMRLTHNMRLAPDGGDIIHIGSVATNWIYGSGVYRILKGARDTYYTVSFSPDGNSGVRVISFQNCQNNYLVVPDDHPYFRISSDYTTIRIKKVKEYSDGLINVRDFGARGDGTSDDTFAIQDAIDYACYGKGGSVYLPNGTFILNTVQEFDNQKANLIIPYNKNTSLYLAKYSPTAIYYRDCRIEHAGNYYYCNADNTTGEWDSSKWEAFSVQAGKVRLNIKGNGRAVTYKSFIASYQSASPPLHQGSFLKSTSSCDLNNGMQTPTSVIACGYSNTANFKMNYNVIVELGGFTLKCDNINGYSRLCGINMAHCAAVYLEDIAVYSAERITEVFFNNEAFLHQSNHFSCGVMMPMLFCDPTSSVKNVTVSGAFTIGFMIGDCQEIENCWVGLCKYGYVQCSAGHPSVVGGHIFCFNTNYIFSSAASVLYNSSLSDSPEWQTGEHYVKDFIVYRGGIFWMCKEDHVSNSFFNESLWSSIDLFGDYNPRAGFLFVNQISIEPAIGIQPVAFNTEFLIYDPSNKMRGEISYINADSPSTDLAVLGAHNIKTKNLGKKQ